MQIYCPGSHGDRPVQAPEDSAPEQRPHLLLPLPDPTRAQVHPLCQRPAPRPEAFQPPAQHHLRSQGTVSQRSYHDSNKFKSFLSATDNSYFRAVHYLFHVALVLQRLNVLLHSS